MPSMYLIDSSDQTRVWIDRIEHLVVQQDHSITTRASKHWFCFTKPPAFAYLHPSHKRIRLFLRLPPGVDKRLLDGPSSGKWAERFPSVYYIEDDSQVSNAVDLIIKCYKGL